MENADLIDEALALLYESKWWNTKKYDQAFTMLQTVFDGNQLGIIRKGYQEGMTRQYLEALTSYPYFNWQQMMIVKEALQKTSLDTIDYVANPIFSADQMRIILKGIKNGLSHEQLDILAQHRRSVSEMKIILGAFENGVSVEDLSRFFYRGIDV